MIVKELVQETEEFWIIFIEMWIISLLVWKKLQ